MRQLLEPGFGNDPFGYYNRALSYKSMGETDRALVDYSKAIELNTGDNIELLCAHSQTAPYLTVRQVIPRRQSKI